MQLSKPFGNIDYTIDKEPIRWKDLILRLGKETVQTYYATIKHCLGRKNSANKNNVLVYY